MAAQLGQKPIVVPDGDEKALPMGLDRHRLNNVERGPDLPERCFP